jgi:L-alanine-DL-glutamate epimerase-like enolase superfamily enzyme
MPAVRTRNGPGFAALLAAGAADIVQPSMTKVGGIGEMKKIATLAAAAG